MTTAPLTLAATMLIPPPIPLPAPELLAAAAEVRAAAPFDQATLDDAFDRAIFSTASAALAKAQPPATSEAIPAALDRLRQRLTVSRPKIDAQASGCVDQSLGYAYDLPTLRDMRSTVATPGGRALWAAATREPLRACYAKALTSELSDFGQAVGWVASKHLLQRLPAAGAASADPSAFGREIEALCGRRATGVLRVKRGVLGMPYTWVDREIKRDSSGETFLCLNYSAKVAGYDLQVFSDE